MSTTVIEHVLARLKAIGISHVFGVAGDYAFPVEDAISVVAPIEEAPGLLRQWSENPAAFTKILIEVS